MKEILGLKRWLNGYCVCFRCIHLGSEFNICYKLKNHVHGSECL